MTQAQKTYITTVLRQHSPSDDLYRAQLAFRGMTPEQMQQQYGQSGKTRQEILDSYQTQYAAWSDVFDALQRIETT